MSKAVYLSKQYREFRERCGVKDPVMLGEIEEAYFEGYNEAEKDLELTWEDIKKLRRLISTKEINDGLFEKEDYEEILKRFKEKRNDNR